MPESTAGGTGRGPIHCAWCDRGITAGDAALPTSHGMCIACAAASGAFALEDMAGLSPAEADALPFGMIRLDAAGVVVAYNATESRLSGRPPEAVIGRSFFDTVAPCTSVREFRGEYDDMVASGDPEPRHLDFIFDIPGNRALVEVLLTWSADEGLGTVLVRRIG